MICGQVALLSAEVPIPAKLTLIVGHALLYAWYYAVGVALGAADGARLRLLWECALTCTLRVRVEARLDELALLSMRISEKFKAQERGMADTFITFTAKVSAIAPPSTSAQRIADILAQRGVSYSGARITKQMVLAIQAVSAMLTESLKSTLCLIDREFGREVLSTSYTKLARVVNLAKTLAGTLSPHGKVRVTDLVEFAVESLLTSLRRLEAHAQVVHSGGHREKPK